jgi:hypothetical protein
MFTALAKSGFAKLWPIQARRLAPRPCQAGSSNHANDNLSGFRRPAAARRRRSPTPVLACRWLKRDGRLQCRWQAEPGGDAPILDRAERQRVARRPGSSARLLAGTG